MPRSRSSYTASPSRYRSPQRSPTRGPVPEEGSQYEIDLSVLGHDSTLGSSEQGNNHVPKVDVIDTSDIDGPEDFTANLTFYMTADLPLSQIKSRKEAFGKWTEARGDTIRGLRTHDITEEGDEAIIEDSSRSKEAGSHFDSGSPTVRANGTSNDNRDQQALFETSMEHDEKVVSYLSALPDTELQNPYTPSPLRLAKQGTLQVPKVSPPKVRSMQAAVEDYDTPRKPTQETVIHHPRVDLDQTATDLNTTDADKLRSQLAELQTRLIQHEGIVSYTRSELELARSENYKYQARIKSLEEHRSQDKKSHEQSIEAKLKESSEELNRQNLAKLQSQRENFENRVRLLEEGKRTVEAQMLQRESLVTDLRHELDQLRASREEGIQTAEKMRSIEQQDLKEIFENEQNALTKKLESLRTRAEKLQGDLTEATIKAETARKEAESARSDAEAARKETRDMLELRSSPDSAAQDGAARIVELETRLRTIQTQLDTSRADVSAKDEQLLTNIEEQERLDHRLNTSQGRIEGLESTVSALRQQLADAQRDTAKARTDVERLEQEVMEFNEKLLDAKREADRRVADAERKVSKVKEQKIEAEEQLRELRSEHAIMAEDHKGELEDVRSRAEDAVRKAGALVESERAEKKRLTKELKSTNAQLDRLQAEANKKAAEEEVEEEDVSISTTHTDSKDQELENLRTLLRKQAAAMKTLKSEHSSLRKQVESYEKIQSELFELRGENKALKAENLKLASTAETQRAEFEAVNKAMDERMAAMLSKVMKERAKTAVTKRDGQWAETVSQLKEEKEFRGKVLLREWGRQECGVAPDGKHQEYCYKYVKRS